MVEFRVDGKIRVSYTNETGGSSTFTITESVAEAIESITGIKFCEWVQMQYDDIIAGHERFNKYILAFKIKGKPMPVKKIGAIIRQTAFDAIPDREFS